MPEIKDGKIERNMSSDDETDSFSSVQADFERLMETVKEFTKELDFIGNNLTKLQTPIETLCIDQLSDAEFLANSPFRKDSFQVNPGFSGFPGIELGKRYPYGVICAALRTYLFRANAITPDGVVKMDANMKTLFKIENDTTTYIELLENLRNILL